MARENNSRNGSSGRSDTSWMNAFATPSRGEFLRFMRGPQAQFSPTIRTLRQQLAAARAGQDPTVRAYEELLGGLPTEEAISGRYQQGLANLAGFMRDVDVARGGRAVSEAVQGIGGAIGADAGTTADVAGAAGAVSGVGGGQDILSQALLQGAEASMRASEAERIGDISAQRQQLRLGAGEARKAARQERQELARLLAQTQGQRAAAAPNPFEIAQMIRGFQQMAGIGGYGGGGYGSGGGAGAGTETGAPTGGVTTEEEYLASLGAQIQREGMQRDRDRNRLTGGGGGRGTATTSAAGAPFVAAPGVLGYTSGSGSFVYRNTPNVAESAPSGSFGPGPAFRNPATRPTSPSPTRRPGTPMGGRG
jgi:hypothetical protein